MSQAKIKRISKLLKDIKSKTLSHDKLIESILEIGEKGNKSLAGDLIQLLDEYKEKDILFNLKNTILKLGITASYLNQEGIKNEDENNFDGAIRQYELCVKLDPKHKWAHIEAVMKRALEIAEKLDNIDYELLKLGVILHDIDYNSESTFEENYKNHVENSIKVAERFLIKNNYPKERIIKLKQIMLDHSTPHRRKIGDSKIKEGKILYDADKSIFITTLERYEKYSPLLYFDETRKLVKKPNH